MHSSLWLIDQPHNHNQSGYEDLWIFENPDVNHNQAGYDDLWIFEDPDVNHNELDYLCR